MGINPYFTHVKNHSPNPLKYGRFGRVTKIWAHFVSTNPVQDQWPIVESIPKAQKLLMGNAFSRVMPGRIGEAFYSWEEAGSQAKNRSNWRINPATIWTVWKERNLSVFENRESNMQQEN